MVFQEDRWQRPIGETLPHISCFVLVDFGTKGFGFDIKDVRTALDSFAKQLGKIEHADICIELAIVEARNVASWDISFAPPERALVPKIMLGGARATDEDVQRCAEALKGWQEQRFDEGIVSRTPVLIAISSGDSSEELERVASALEDSNDVVLVAIGADACRFSLACNDAIFCANAVAPSLKAVFASVGEGIERSLEVQGA